MRWEGRRRSTNVDDRRGQSGRMGLPRGGRVRLPGRSRGGVRRAGGSSILLFVVIAILLWVFAGIHPLKLFEILAGGGGGTMITDNRASERTPEQRQADDERAQFLSVVLAETEDTWNRILADNGARYTPPTLVLYDGATQTGCGLGQAATGPFYCPVDTSVYVDLTFFDLLDQRLGAPGDFAQAYVLAHEVGHHVQKLAGTLDAYQSQRQRLDERSANALSVRLELQADCYAGIWAHAADRSGIVEEGDIDEALRAASAVGDDILQRQQQGYVVPETFNHGTAAQRSRWFRIGYQSGDARDCDTFGTTSL